MNKSTYTLIYRVIMLNLGMAWFSSFAYASQSANKIESISSLKNVVQQFLNHQFKKNSSVQFNIGKLDPRLRLKACPGNIQAFVPANQQLLGHTSIGLRCKQNMGWTIHVPVYIQQFRKVLVIQRNLPRGQSLTAADVTQSTLDVSTLPQGYFEDVSQVKGLILNRSILRGQVLIPGQLSKPRWVKRGQTVTILAESGQFSIRATGKALMDGREGDLVQVKNTNTNKKLQGTVVAEGVIRVAL